MNPLKKLANLGQSVWLDYIRRSLMTSGELKRLIGEDGLKGVTSNPAIFEKAITGSNDYADILESVRAEHNDAMKLYEVIALRDIQDAADILLSVYQESNRRDGYVSLEVSPYFARDTQATIKEARRLWEALGCENAMIKVPATPEGIPAVEQLISEGINVNVTLIFSRDVYEQVADAYVAGLRQLKAKGGDLSRVASVASFFISRIDSVVDAELRKKLRGTILEEHQELAERIAGKVAIANAKLAYQSYRIKFNGRAWDELAQAGAQTQRVLWASTGTKDPSYRDTLYIEELIGPDTVNTIPPSTFDAFRDHGEVRISLDEDVEEAWATMETLQMLNISFGEITNALLESGLLQFSEAFDKLLRAVDTRCACAGDLKITAQTYTLPEDVSSSVHDVLKDWNASGKVRRLWARDESLWTNSGESGWLGWLGITEDQTAHIYHLTDLVYAVRDSQPSHVVVLGMGGSSLCPDVLKSAFGKIDGFPELLVLDSTDPQQIATVEEQIDYQKTVFIVSSKSGSTLEPNIFKQYFYDRAKAALGNERAGSHFVAITDPGSDLEKIATVFKFRHTFHGVASIGGRYSALSNFGMVPATAMGIDVAKLMDRADEMAVACSPCVPVEDNPGVILGAILGACGNAGRDKVTLIMSPGIHGFGAWLEQLLAESTGKNGKGLIPVDREELGSPDVYGRDRIFVYLRLRSGVHMDQEEAVADLEKAGHPVIRIELNDLYDLGREFFRWEMATAVAGSVMHLNPFDQPDVEASKLATSMLTDQYEKSGSLPDEKPFFEQDGIVLFADGENAGELESAVGSDKSLSGYLREHIQRLQDGDYFALLAFIPMDASTERALQELRTAVRDRHHAATCLGFGPRFLHSTGQAYKGGPNTGVFLQITCDDVKDVQVPGQRYTFGIVKSAQARGDFQVLNERERRAIRVHLPADVDAGLSTLRQAFQDAFVEEPAMR